MLRELQGKRPERLRGLPSVDDAGPGHTRSVHTSWEREDPAEPRLCQPLSGGRRAVSSAVDGARDARPST
jgi:hypothetical protein